MATATDADVPAVERGELPAPRRPVACAVGEAEVREMVATIRLSRALSETQLDTGFGACGMTRPTWNVTQLSTYLNDEQMEKVDFIRA